MADSAWLNGDTWPRPGNGVRAWSACAAMLALWAGTAVGGEPATLRPAAARPLPTGRPAAKVDPAVMPAGGHRAPRCGQCGRAACPQCRASGGHGAAHTGCQHGMCPAHCPVRPDVFGFYGTQWRRWPGSGVVPASATDAAAPARPARSQVPSAAEESLPRDEAGVEPAAPPKAVVPEDETTPPVAAPAAAEEAGAAATRDGAEPQAAPQELPADPPAARAVPESPRRPDVQPVQAALAVGPAPDPDPSPTAWRSFTAAARRAAPP
jgi:hypothetical protein